MRNALSLLRSLLKSVRKWIMALRNFTMTKRNLLLTDCNLPMVLYKQMKVVLGGRHVYSARKSCLVNTRMGYMAAIKPAHKTVDIINTKSLKRTSIG